MRLVSGGHRSASRLFATTLLLMAASSCGGTDVRQFLAFKAPIVALINVRVIDGTGRPPRDSQTVVIQAERITAVGDTEAVPIPGGAKVLVQPERSTFAAISGSSD